MIKVLFGSEPEFQRAPRGEMRLTRPLLARAYVDGAFHAFEVPAGFLTDGASVPPVFWIVVGHPYSPSSLRAAVLHDWLCRAPRAHGLNSAECARIFFAALRQDGCAWVRSWLMATAVRWFGPQFARGH